MTSLYLSKMDVAKRELEYSIRLFFLSGEPVVIHLISSTAQEILKDICKKQKVKTYIDQIMESIKSDKRQIVRKKLKEAYNFIKHADNDPKNVIEFNPESTDFVIWGSVEMYQSLSNDLTGLMFAYRAWFYQKYQNLITDIGLKNFYKEYEKQIDTNNRLIYLDVANEYDKKRTI